MRIGTRLAARVALTTALLAGTGVAYSSTRSASSPSDAALIDSSGLSGRIGHRRRHRTKTTVAPAPTTTTATSSPGTDPTTTTTAAPGATTTVAATTTTKPTTAPTTATTAAPTPTAATTATTTATTVANGGGGGTAIVDSGCVFKTAPSASVAFCDSFDTPEGDPATRSGDLNAEVWGVSRTGTNSNVGQQQLNRFYPATLLGCGAAQKVLPPNDVKICNGRVVEAFWDHEGQATIAMYPKQPFDIGGGRTGTVVFDVSADSEEPHAAWPEFWWTDKPVPAAHADISAHAPYARHSFGFSIAGTSIGINPCGSNRTTIDRVMVTRNYQKFDIPFSVKDCVIKGSATGALNHFELRINANRAEIYASDAGSTNVKLIATADNLNLSFTKGLVWLEHLSYNACKFNNQCDHTFAWDNLGFDGPLTYRDLSFDVPDANTPQGDGSRALGFLVGPSTIAKLTTVPVYRKQTPTGAIVTFNWWAEVRPIAPSFRLNGGAWHDNPWPYTTESEGRGWRTLDVPVPVSEVRDGPNTIEFKSADGQIVANVNVIFIAGAAVPTK